MRNIQVNGVDIDAVTQSNIVRRLPAPRTGRTVSFLRVHVVDAVVATLTDTSTPPPARAIRGDTVRVSRVVSDMLTAWREQGYVARVDLSSWLWTDKYATIFVADRTTVKKRAWGERR